LFIDVARERRESFALQKLQNLISLTNLGCEINVPFFGISSGHIFAAKFIPVSHSLEKELIRREIDIMNQLHHPKLINLHDAFEDDDEMVLIYEL